MHIDNSVPITFALDDDYIIDYVLIEERSEEEAEDEDDKQTKKITLFKSLNPSFFWLESAGINYSNDMNIKVGPFLSFWELGFPAI
ncbi:hypothetical protein AVEN_25972-1 [Araneus ventricosus]|uniref:Uncharacterized protein n=1 Tax=Araneus ventricosus TaxID=182803 RepID=A0A4Y2FI67_ARAVE|nr:hypothetical protein AVEN_25972-1 [Araneus ventricosus]